MSAHHRPQAVGVRQQVLDDLVDRDRAAVEDLHEQVVLLVERALDLLAQDVLVEEVLHADADAVDLVGVGRADAAAGRADLALAEEALGHLVERAVVLRDDVRVRADLQPRGVDAAGVQRLELGEEHLEVDRRRRCR